MIQAVIFDMDGLLVDSEPYWREAEKKVFGKLGLQLSDSMCKETMGLRIDEVVAYWYQKHPWNRPIKKDVETDILLNVIELVIEYGKAMPGADYIINFFQKKNLPLALASSSAYRLIQSVVAKLNIRDKFQVIYSAEQEPYGKPHPGIFLTAAKGLRVAPQNCLVLEDSLTGIIAAKAARMQAVMIPDKDHREDPRNQLADVVLNNLEEFTEEVWKKFQGGF